MILMLWSAPLMCFFLGSKAIPEKGKVTQPRKIDDLARLDSALNAVQFCTYAGSQAKAADH